MSLKCAVLVEQTEQFSADFTLCQEPTDRVDETYRIPVCKKHWGSGGSVKRDGSLKVFEGVTVWDKARSVFVGLGQQTKFVKESDK